MRKDRIGEIFTWRVWPVLAVRNTQYNHQLGAGLTAGRNRLECVSVLELAMVNTASLGLFHHYAVFSELHSAQKQRGIVLNSLGCFR